MIREYFQKFYIDLALSYSMPITEAVHILCMIVLFNGFENRPKYYIRVVVHFAVLWASEILLKSVFYHFGWIISIPAAMLIAAYALLCGFVFKTKKIEYCVLYGLYLFVITFFSQSFVKAVGAMFCMAIKCEYEVWIANIFLTIGKIMIFVGFAVIAKLRPLERYDKPTVYDFVFISVLAVITIFAYAIVDNIKDFTNGVLNPTETEQALFIFAIGLLICILHCVAYQTDYIRSRERQRRAKFESEFDAVKEQYNAQRDTMSLSQENLDEMRRIRHDIKNQINYMQLILEQGKYDELRKYFNELNGKVALPLSFSDCSNRVIRDVLNMEISKLPHGIKIDYSVAVSDELAIEDLDLTTVLINLLDNAIEACERDKAKDAVIGFTAREDDMYLFVAVSNPVTDERAAKEYFENGTSKSDKLTHGLGKKIISAIVDKHDGAIKHTVENGIFRVEIMLANVKEAT